MRQWQQRRADEHHDDDYYDDDDNCPFVERSTSTSASVLSGTRGSDWRWRA
ncbi:MAG: hypothetical protein J2P17_10160 [Mycobacterium sp.]|nr:hypothetical protein [Mycobacterium sp.]